MTTAEVLDRPELTPEFHTTLVEELEFLQPDDERLGDSTRELVCRLQEYGLAIGIGVHESQIKRLGEMAGQEHISSEFCPNDIASRFTDRETIVNKWLKKGTGRVMVGIYAARNKTKDEPEGDSYALYDDNGNLMLHKTRLSNEQLANLKGEDVVQLSYGWFGAEPVEEMPVGVDITTAYRVSKEGQEWARLLNRERQLVDPTAKKLRMGLALGQAVTAVITELWNIDRRRIGLETWHSNIGAIALYRELGFRHLVSARGKRPSKGREAGDTMELVFAEEDIPNMLMQVFEEKGKLMVGDIREYMVQATDEELAEMRPKPGERAKYALAA